MGAPKSYSAFFLETNNEQECIRLGCVPSAAVLPRGVYPGGLSAQERVSAREAGCLIVEGLSAQKVCQPCRVMPTGVSRIYRSD